MRSLTNKNNEKALEVCGGFLYWLVLSFSIGFGGFDGRNQLERFWSKNVV
jgi:hypothetical protein